jgi:PTS system mannose-specific IIC component
MISRPFISATIGGAVLGNAGAGMLVGALLELLTMRHPPFGAAKYPDTGPAGLVAGGSFAATGGISIEALIVALLAGWVVGWMGAYSGYARRKLNERLVAPSAQLAANGKLLERRHRLAIGLDAIRGGMLVGAMLVPSVLIVAFVSTMVVAPAATTIGAGAVVTAFAASVGAGARTTSPDGRAWAMVLLGALLVLASVWGRP